MELKKKAIFRVIFENLKNRKHRTLTIYEGKDKITFEKFIAKITRAVQDI